MDEDFAPEEGDLTTSDHIHFYQDGRHVLTIRGGADASETSMWRQLDAYMKRSNFYPNVWFISDHGNAHLLQRPRGGGKRRHRRLWIQGALAGHHEGALHRSLHVPMGEKIPLSLERRAAKRPGKLGRRARLALTLRKISKRRKRHR